MDNILIVIAVIAFFLFSTYSNYKKEQEKANTRDPSKPQNRPTSPGPSAEDPHPIEIPKWLEDFLPPQAKIESKPKPIPVESYEHTGSIDYKTEKYERVKYVPSELPADLLKEYRNLPEKLEFDEVKRARAMHSSPTHHNALKALVIEDDVGATAIEVPSFDLRQAIIMNAILQRPYQ
jgi:hypothetical protein